MDSSTVQKAVKNLGWLFVALIVFIAILSVNALKENRYIGGGVPAGNVITVSGEGEVFAVPDIAEFTYTVYAEAKTVGEAQEMAAEKGNAIIAFLKGEGIAEKDIRTVSYSANPKYEWTNQPTPLGAEIQVVEPYYGGGTSGSAGVSSPDYYYPQPRNQVIVGYEVRQSVSVKVRDTEKVGELLAGVGEKGATDIYGPNFTIDEEDALQRAARKLAIKDAQEKAEQLADDLDVRLVRVVSFSENGGGYYPMYAREEFDMAVASDGKATPEIPLGENKISANVSITYEIR
ncbi:MAG: SIMPL domain-containing protein [Candidatus Campbellbacteria bacterium]